MVSYSTIRSGSNSSNSSDETLTVHLYPNTSSDDSQCENTLADALDVLGQQALDNDSAYRYEVKISYDHPNLDTSSKDAFWNDWRGYSNGRDSYAGSHVAVNSKNIGGRAQSPRNPGAWNGSFDAICGFADPVEHYKNTIIQEVLHSFIDQSLSSVESRYSDSEHDLGTVYSGAVGDGPTSPMCTSYEDTHGRHGSCATDAPWNWTYTTALTDCSLNSLKDTSDSA